MRRGLATTDGAEADRLVDEMNVLLRDRAWWSADKRPEAEQRFSTVVVSAFYHEIRASRQDPEVLRDEIIPLPTADDDYSRVQLVGTTGAGKTSLLRQLINSDPDKDRFPSTAPAKTTIADIEVVQSDGVYEAVVTFFSEFQVQASIEECILDSCAAARDKMATDKVAERLLNHRDQKFRLSYILGAWDPNGTRADEDAFSFDDESDADSSDQSGGILPRTERIENQRVLESLLERIAALAARALDRLHRDLGIDVDIKVDDADRETAEELVDEYLEEYVLEDEGFHELVHDVLDRVRIRFDLVKEGTMECDRSGWPKRWQLVATNRDEFITEIRWFSSNYWPHFGQLLTPLVSGIRVKGPLFPLFKDAPPRLVLIDGQGLGHTPDSTSSLTTHITRRFDHVDVIMLVDNAKQPMQAAPLSVLRSVAPSGHSGKLAIAFTHFDQIKGSSLRTAGDKRRHVMGSVLNALSNLRDTLGAPVTQAIEQSIEERCFMLGGVDRGLSKLPGRAADYMRAELSALIAFCEQAILPPPPPEARPIYDPTGISFAVREAVSKFQSPWLARLGISGHEGVRKEHWTRVKALNRRIAGELDIEYDSLRPVADLVARITESVSRYLDNPIDWTAEPEDDQERLTAIAEIRRAVSTQVHEFALESLVGKHLGEWREAFELRGKGSTFERARTIRGIYDDAAPIPDVVMSPASKQLIADVRRIVTAAIAGSGGDVRLVESS